jgi:hypothetical protein
MLRPARQEVYPFATWRADQSEMEFSRRTVTGRHTVRVAAADCARRAMGGAF